MTGLNQSWTLTIDDDPPYCSQTDKHLWAWMSGLMTTVYNALTSYSSINFLIVVGYSLQLNWKPDHLSHFHHSQYKSCIHVVKLSSCIHNKIRSYQGSLSRWYILTNQHCLRNFPVYQSSWDHQIVAYTLWHTSQIIGCIQSGSNVSVF